jgi:hypothetical protein
MLCHIFWKSAASSSPQKLVKFALGTILEKQIDTLSILKVPIESQNILMLQGALDLNLSLNLIN